MDDNINLSKHFRQYFEEIQTAKVAIPSWQLNKTENATSAKVETENTKVKVPSWQTNGPQSGEDNNFKTNSETTKPEGASVPSSKNEAAEPLLTLRPSEACVSATSENKNIPVSVSVMSEDGDPIVTSPSINGVEHKDNRKIASEFTKKEAEKQQSSEKSSKGKKWDKKN